MQITEPANKKLRVRTLVPKYQCVCVCYWIIHLVQLTQILAFSGLKKEKVWNIYVV